MTFPSPRWLWVPYVFNVVILVPVCHQMFLGRGVDAVFGGHVVESPGLRTMVGSLWGAILVASLAGLRWPAFFAPVTLIQVFYKALWLATCVGPMWFAKESIPMGITRCFVFIVVTYPVCFALALRG